MICATNGGCDSEVVYLDMQTIAEPLGHRVRALTILKKRPRHSITWLASNWSELGTVRPREMKPRTLHPAYAG
jgi:hypothetical protein